MNQLNFSGHETFHCRHFWLKKGCDFLGEGHRFNENEAVVELGVGKNMVQSIRSWLRAFGLYYQEKGELDPLAASIFGDKGWDPYLEDPATLWLLHYLLVKSGHFDIYRFVFNELRKERVEFTEQQFLNFLQRKAKQMGDEHSEKTLKSDIKVFLKNYVRPQGKDKNIEDEYSGLLIDLGMIKQFHRQEDGAFLYRVESAERPEIPTEVILYTILERFPEDRSFSFSRLLNEENGPGMVFALNSDGLYEHLRRIELREDKAVLSDDAGIKELQLEERPEPLEVLKGYYEN